MTTNAEKIAEWREANPDTQITEAVLRDGLGLDNLYGADLYGADLYGADLCGASLHWADLREASLRWANLRQASLTGADLRQASLTGADLRETDLYGAAVRSASWQGLALDAGPSGTGDFRPTPTGWRISIGCWRNKTLADLRDLIEDRAEWPEADTPEERDRRRPYLRSVLGLCEAHDAYNSDAVADLAKRWGRVTIATQPNKETER